MRTLTRFTTGPMTALDRRYDTQIHRRVTRTVMVGHVPVGLSLIHI